MTTMIYIVAYLHPEVPPSKRIQQLTLDSKADWDAVIEWLRNTYPNHQDDLEDATLWKVSRSTTTQLPP